ncbi:Crp/Fnr family transcriptional regulator [Kordiimonas lacus]|uniref:cAMP-binding domain of CRP or a regulatory subunit of cAMP-dependent protein kinases n=1 Tax=Kordiimonas lacus TaxID=637679 RepID=A0A1G6ZFM8_9PROT|nr:Crp/Fnr family transcriptional regulator [Kordiimonas lacus]SDE01360.1 cAMP-binding domain of CRP or a regulatory subunit of cAMP-dependent protein kinases [Kordiimonas lacus]
MAQIATAYRDEAPIAAHLESQPLFRGMAPELRATFIQAAQMQTLSKGSILFLQDDESEWFYLILSGWVKLFTETMDGDEAVIDMVSNGHLIGDSAILEDGIHSFGAAAVEPVTAIRLPSSLLKQAITDDHKTALAMLGSLSRHRKRQSREIESLTLQNASQRIGCFLLRLCNPDVPMPLTLTLPYDKSLIAARLGMKSETFSRALNKLRTETTLAIKGSVVTISDLDELSGYVCSACSNEFPCRDLHS